MVAKIIGRTFGKRDVPASPRVFELAGASYLMHVGCWDTHPGV